jgi:hypothetical protein
VRENIRRALREVERFCTSLLLRTDIKLNTQTATMADSELIETDINKLRPKMRALLEVLIHIDECESFICNVHTIEDLFGVIKKSIDMGLRLPIPFSACLIALAFARNPKYRREHLHASGVTLLHCASRAYRNTVAIQTLIALGADTGALSENCFIPLQLACDGLRNNPEIIRELMFHTSLETLASQKKWKNEFRPIYLQRYQIFMFLLVGQARSDCTLQFLQLDVIRSLEAFL